MKISVFGLGYVGAVTAGCLARSGHQVIGVDVQQQKVDDLNSGRSPIIEPGLDEMLSAAVAGSRLSATTDAADAVRRSDVSIICVGTPSLASGGLNLEFVRKVCGQIAEALSGSAKRQAVIFRSTMLPGSTRSLVTEFFADLIHAGRLRVCYCPEFLREGAAVRDFIEPSLAIIGTADGRPPEGGEAEELIGGSPAILAWEGAEMIKYACNYFHALKVGFANEIGRLCKRLGEDGSRVMDVLCSDTKLNISSYYLRPGNPYGGSCLPKDVSALNSLARQEGVNVPLLSSMTATNQAHLDLLLKLVTSKGRKRIGLLGLAFKAGTDDVRGSHMVALAETLLAQGFQVRIFDPGISIGRLIGANEIEIHRRMPHLADHLVADPLEVIRQSDVIVASQKCIGIESLRDAANGDQHIIDVNGWPELKDLPCKYEGLCW